MTEDKKSRHSFGTLKERSGKWTIRYTGTDGRRYTETIRPGRSKAGRKRKGYPLDAGLALDRLFEIKTEIDEGAWVPPEQKKRIRQNVTRTVGSWMDEFHKGLDSRNNPNTMQNYRRVTNNRITGVDGPAGKLAKVRLSKLTENDFLQWWTAINEQFPPKPYTKVSRMNEQAYGRLRAAMSRAVQLGYLDKNPIFLEKEDRKVTTKDKDLPKKEELEAILKEMPERYKLICALTYFHGLRIGEALGLKTKNVLGNATDGYRIKIESNVQRLTDEDGRTYVEDMGTTKTKAGIRTVQVFAEHWGLVETHLKKFASDTYLTLNANGTLINDVKYREHLAPACERAGVRYINPHKGRDWLITELAEAGATPKEIGRILGQTDLKTILQIYMQVKEARPDALMNELNSKLFASKSGEDKDEDKDEVNADE